jgi:hypothetical protein
VDLDDWDFMIFMPVDMLSMHFNYYGKEKVLTPNDYYIERIFDNNGADAKFYIIEFRGIKIGIGVRHH